MAIGNSYYVVENGKRELHFCMPNTLSGVHGAESLFENKKINGAMWLAVYRRSMLSKYQICFSENYSCNEDFDFMLNCAIHVQKVAFIDWSYYNYFRDNQTSTYKQLSGEKIWIYMEVCRKWYDYFESHRDEYSYAANALRGITEHSQWALQQMERISAKDAKFCELRKYFTEARYVYWPEQPTKNFTAYLSRRRMQIKLHGFLHRLKMKIKLIITKRTTT
jgi:sarcosine oxidase delta subunit